MFVYKTKRLYLFFIHNCNSGLLFIATRICCSSFLSICLNDSVSANTIIVRVSSWTSEKIGLKNYGTDNADALNFKNNNVTGKNKSFEYANHISNSKKDKQYIKKMFEANNQLHPGWWFFYPAQYFI